MSDTNANTAQQDRLFATLSYVVPFFLLVPLIQKQSHYASFHAVQALVLWVAAVAVSIALSVVLAVMPIAIVGQLLGSVFGLATLAAVVFGAIQAWQGNETHLPVIGQKGADMFAKFSN